VNVNDIYRTVTEAPNGVGRSQPVFDPIEEESCPGMVVGGRGLTFVDYAIEILRFLVSSQEDIPLFCTPVVAGG
jgi:hypothetical protein